MDAGELHNDGANEDGEPRESIFEHVEIDGFLIKTFAFHSGEGGQKVKNHTEHGKEHHAVIANLGRFLNALDGLDN